MLELDHIQLAQGGFRLGAHWSLPAGARAALLGPSGEGKSTLLSALAGFVAPEAGAIRWRGADLAPLPPGARPLTILFQEHNLFPHLSLADNLGLGLSPDLRLGRADRARIAAALERVGLAGLGARRPGTLSGGQQGRAALARALLRARPMLLLDEPFAALGPAMKADMLALVDELAAEADTTVLMVTHDPRDAERLCPLTVVVADGRAEAPAPTAALLHRPPPALAAYLGR
jgi:thiamine transport system ATP-binding protein